MLIHTLHKFMHKFCDKQQIFIELIIIKIYHVFEHVNEEISPLCSCLSYRERKSEWERERRHGKCK